MNYDHLYTACTTSGLLTATGAAKTYDTTVTISFSIGGKAYSKTAITTGTTPTSNPLSVAHTNLGTLEGCVLVWTLTSGGTVGLWQSAVKELDAAEAFIVAPDFPKFDLETYCPFAYQVLVAGSDISGSTSSTGVFDIGTDNWNSTGLTSTIVNVHRLPRRPQES